VNPFAWETPVNSVPCKGQRKGMDTGLRKLKMLKIITQKSFQDWQMIGF